MQTYRNTLKLASKHILNASIFVVIFIFLTMMNSIPSSNSYKKVQLNLAIINKDKSKEADYLIDRLSKDHKIEYYEDKKEVEIKLLDNRIIGMIVLEKDSIKNYLENNQPIEVKNINDPKYGVFVSQDIRQILSVMKLNYKNGTIDLAGLNRNLDNKVDVEYLNSSISNEAGGKKWYMITFSYFGYMILLLSMTLINLSMADLNQDFIRKRNYMAPIGKLRVFLERSLGQFTIIILSTLTLVLIITLMGLSPIGAGRPIKLDVFGKFMINILVYCITTLGMILLINAVNKNKKLIHLIINSVPLILCFISGIFIPINLLDSTIVSIAKFFPTYYFVEQIRIISDGGNLSFHLISMMLIIGLAYTIIGLFIENYRKEIAEN